MSTATKGWKTANAQEREKAAKQRTAKGVDYIQSELEQFVPIDGDNQIRIVPPLAEDEMASLWGVDVWTYFLSGHSYLSPQVFDKHAKNPVYDAYKEMKQEDPELCKKLQLGGSKKTLLFILDMNDGGSKPVLKIWAAPPTLVNDFIRISRNRKTGKLIALDDPEDGRVIFFTRTGSGVSTKYSGVQIDNEPYPLDVELLDQIPLFTDILVKPDIAELTASLEETLSGKTDDRDEDKQKFSRRRQTEEEEERPKTRAPRRERDELEDELPEQAERSSTPNKEMVDDLRARLRAKTAKKEDKDEVPFDELPF